MIAAFPANQFVPIHPEASMERGALAARVEYRAHLAVVAAREHEAQALARVIGVREKPRAAGTHRGHVDHDFVVPGHRCAIPGRDENEKRGGAGCEHQTAENLEPNRTHHKPMLSQRTASVKARPNRSASLP